MCAHSLDPHSDGFSKSLAESLGLAHFQGEDLTTGQSCEGCVRAKRLGDACRKKKKKSQLDVYSSYSIYLLLWWKHNLSQLHQCKATIWLPWEDGEIILCSGEPPMWPLPIAMAVFPVPGWPAISTALPAMWPSLIISRMTPAARREASWPTIPWDTCRWIGTGTLEANLTHNDNAHQSVLWFDLSVEFTPLLLIILYCCSLTIICTSNLGKQDFLIDIYT